MTSVELRKGGGTVRLSNQQVVESFLCSEELSGQALPKSVSELDLLRQRTGAGAALVFAGSPSRKNRLLAASVTGPTPCPPGPLVGQGGYQLIERAGCAIALLPDRPPQRKPKTPGERVPTLELEELVARALGRLILGEAGSVIFQVSEPDSRCLALSSPTSLENLREAKSVAQSDRPVLIIGNTGVGKELLARYIHLASGRKNFVAISMAQMRGETAVSELFGHVEGAFTGATSRRLGAFLEAGEGTLFLDEISEMPRAAAALLLRAIEEKRIKPLGSDRELEAPARVLAATNRPDMLREDLYYRFVHRITVPALKDREEDIRAIALFVAFKEGFEISEKALRALQVVSAWKGNARELEYVLFNAKSLAGKRCLGIHDVMRALSSPSRVSLGGEKDRSRIREIRERLGLSLRYFAQLLDIPKSTLEDIEKGKSPARQAEVLHQLTKYLEKTLTSRDGFQRVQKSARMKEELRRFLAEE